jgi:hypothetical protein
MVATIINAVAVVFGTIIGLFVGSRLSEAFRSVVFSAIGVVSLVIGVSMALETERFLYLAFSLVIGGLAGTALRIEDGIMSFGEWLKRLSGAERSVGDESRHRFAAGFLNSSVLFCVGALTILGAFQAGVEREYGLILTKSVLDGFMAILLTAAYGIGVGFSAISILVYQGGLTLLAGVVSPYVTPLMLSEISGVGGAMIVMIGFNLLDIHRFKTADYLPALVAVVLLVLVDPWIGSFVL